MEQRAGVSGHGRTDEGELVDGTDNLNEKQMMT